MSLSILEHEAALQFAVFLLALALMVLWEASAPRRTAGTGRTTRWPTNLLILVIGTVLVRLAFPIVAFSAAITAEGLGWGLFNALSLPLWADIVLGVLALDLALYGLHRALHAVPLLWRLHKAHHTDRDVDVTTALRVHPFEIGLTVAFKTCVVVLLGAAPVTVLVFEVLRNGTAMFNHGNVSMPAAMERTLRRVLVTPDMHRVHHSVRPEEYNCNFSFCFSVWDRLFDTYQDEPRGGHAAMELGQHDVRGARADSLWRTLTLPFRT